MSVTAAIVRELIAAGVTGDALVMALERIEAAAEPKVSAGALRTRRWRERHQASQRRHGDAQPESVTVTSRDVTSDAAYIDRGSKKVRKKISRPLAPDWVPTPQGRDYAKSKGWTDQRIDSEGERFRDHSLASGRLHADVEAAWRKWVTSPYQTANGARASPGFAPRPGSREDRQEKTANAYAKLVEFTEAGARERGKGGPAGPPDVGLLPLPEPPRS